MPKSYCVITVQMLSAPCCCPPSSAGNSSLVVNTPSSSGNVYFSNGPTDRILVPYKIRDIWSNIGANIWNDIRTNMCNNTRTDIITDKQPDRISAWISSSTNHLAYHTRYHSGHCVLHEMIRPLFSSSTAAALPSTCRATQPRSQSALPKSLPASRRLSPSLRRRPLTNRTTP
jgi:hypothetical protein